MSIKVFHTGDIHIGMKFNRYSDSVREQLIEARFLSLEKMIQTANEKACDIFAVAGDLFNSITVPQKDIRRAVNILNGFNGEYVLVLPGNHDYDSEMNDLWKNFTDCQSDKIIFLNEKKIYEFSDLNLAVYPAPCDSKHSKVNALGWIKEKGVSKDFKYSIGIAHGAVEGLSPDMQGEYFYMSEEELMDIPVDIWLIGHTHVAYPDKDTLINSRIYNAGTPEPDGLDYRGEGSAFIIEIDDEIRAERVKTGTYRFYSREYTVNSEEDIENLISKVTSDAPKNKLMKLTLKGSLDKDIYMNLKEYYDRISSELMYAEFDDGDLREIIDEETIEREFTKGSFPYEFLTSLADDKEALQIAYDLIRRK